MHHEIPYANGNSHARVSASRMAQDELAQIELEIAATPDELMPEALRLCTPRIEDMIEHGVADRTETSDALWRGCVGSGIVARRGADAVQQMFVEARAAADWRKSAKILPADEPDMSVVQRNQIAAPPFPLEILGEAADWVKSTAESKSAPIDYVALSFLATAAGLIGPKMQVSPWAGWCEPIILWVVLAGPPSFSKSPSSDDLREAVRAIERDLNHDWEARLATYEEKRKIAEARLAVWEQELRKLKVGEEPPAMPEVEMPKPPTRKRLCIGDTTTEKAVRLLAENPWGLICTRDELRGLFGGFDKYGGSGNDRAFWIEAYGGRSYRYDRVGLKDGAIDVPFNAVSLIGSIQPDGLHSMLLSGDDDGLAARFIFAWPDMVAPRRPSRTPDHSRMREALRRLSAINFNTDEAAGILQPQIVKLQTDAADEFQRWWEHTQWNAKRAANGKLAGAVGKLDGTLLRLAHVLEFLAWAWSEDVPPQPREVSLSAVRHAIRLIEDWVRPNLERVFAEASLPRVRKDAMAIGQWLLKTKPDSINARALRRQAGFSGPKDVKALDDALGMLVDARWLLLQDDTTGRRGRPRKDFDVNPAIYRETI